jgi:methionine synthase II (cobalamin-independent)
MEMDTVFKPGCRPTLIGSLPVTDHAEAHDIVMAHTPEIPPWVQLPAFRQEGMVPQFLPGMPGLKAEGDREFIDTAGSDFESELVAFYEAYMAADEDAASLDTSRFALTAETAAGFFTLAGSLEVTGNSPYAVKGQVTGPITFATGVKDQNDQAIFYNLQLRDAAVKLLALKARWQVRVLSKFKQPVIIFLDEPALAGFGSSEFISITREEVIACLEEVAAAIHAEGGLAGVHVCANTDWSMILGASMDIINFDAYAYFDRFILYPDELKTFINGGGILAWGIVPTLKVEDIESESAASLEDRWGKQLDQVVSLGIDRQTVKAQSLITPSCGTGSLSRSHALKVLEMTRDLSRLIRQKSD